MDGPTGVALGGIVLSMLLGYLGYRTARDARDDAHKLATETRAAASDDARTARLFDARRSVYVDVMDYVYRIETYVDRIEPVWSWEGAPGPPAFPSEEEQRRQSADIATVGSAAMLAKLDEYKEAAQQFEFAVAAFQNHKAQVKHWVELRDIGVNAPEPEDKERDYRKDVTDRRADVKAMVRELATLMNADLAR
jgi:hypothetical protein